MRRYVVRSSSDDDGCAGCLALLGAGVLVAIGSIVLWVLLAAVPLWLVWNWIVPQVFPGLVRSGTVLGQISLIQAIGLALLTGLVFGAGKLVSTGK